MRLVLRILRSTYLVGGAAAGLLVMAFAANALLLQASRHPAPWFATRGEASPPERGAERDVVRDVQRMLGALQLYRGEADGIAGPETVAAVRAFEKAAGMPATGVPTQALLAELERRRAPPARPLVRVAAGAASGDPRVFAVQVALDRAAYGPLEADGLLGRRTREAVARFQADHGLAPSGEIDDALIERLRKVGAMEPAD